MFTTRAKIGWMVGGIGIGLVAGFLLTSPRDGAESLFPSRPLYASAAATSDQFAVATGSIDQDVEGYYTLDFLTGDLQCVVVYPKTGKMGARFRANVLGDLPPERGKRPTYLLVTGNATLPAPAKQLQPARSLAYVLDTATGKFAIYGFAYSAADAGNQKVQDGPMNLIGTNTAREIRGGRPITEEGR